MSRKVGDYIVARMRRENLTYEQLESATGISRSQLNALVNKPDVTPQLSTLAQISASFGIPLYELIEAAGFDLGLPPGTHDDATVALYSLDRMPPQERRRTWEQMPEQLRASIRALMQTLLSDV